MRGYNPSVFNPEFLYHHIQHLPLKNGVVLAYSGGLDSHVLLHALAQLPRHTCPLRAIHVHHGLHPNAQQWADHCTLVCQELQIPLTTLSITISKTQGQSLEALARIGRYRALMHALKPQEILMTAHHQNDQAETVLLRLLRGSGPKGLCAIPEEQSFSDGLLVRPLLSFNQASLIQYAKDHGLHWVEDDSNQQDCYDRNFIRHHIIPSLEKRWPAVVCLLSRTAKHCTEAQTLMDHVAVMDFNQAVIPSQKACVLDIHVLKQMDPARLHHLIRYWLHRQHYPVPSTIKLEQIGPEVIHARSDRSPILTWAQVEIRRYRHRLYALDKQQTQPIDPNTSLVWHPINGPITLPLDLGQLSPDVLPDTLQCHDNALTIRFRQGGEKLGSRSLKNIFQERGIPPWQRARTPLIYQDDQLVHVATCPEFG